MWDYSMIIFTFFVIASFFNALTWSEECPTVGIQCDSSACNVVLCPTIGAEPHSLVDCAASETHCALNGTTYKFECQPGRCRDLSIPHNITCTAPGPIPSPYDCSISYLCTEANSSPFMKCNCSVGEYYDTTTGTCVIGQCARNPVVCDYASQNGPFEGSFCFVCDPNLDALIYRCSGSRESSQKLVSPRSLNCTNYSGPD